MHSFVTALLSLPRRLLIGLLRAYRLLFSPWIGGVCLYEPTCSAYAIEAVQRHGALAGSWLAGGRLLRCRPWCCGGDDPVPHDPPRLFAFLRDPTESGASRRPGSTKS